MLRNTFDLVPNSTHCNKIHSPVKPLGIDIIALDPRVDFAEQVGAC
jgi:hypothetical protein